MAANPPHYELDTNGIHGYCANFLWKNFQVIFSPLYQYFSSLVSIMAFMVIAPIFYGKNFQVIFPPFYHNPGFMYLPEKRHFIREVLPHQIKIIFEVSPYFLYFNRNSSIFLASQNAQKEM